MGARRASSCSPVYLSPAATGGGAGVAAAGGGGAAGAGVLGEQLLSANIAATASRKGACVIFEASALASAGRGYPSHARQGRDRGTPDVGRYLPCRRGKGLYRLTGGLLG